MDDTEPDYGNPDVVRINSIALGLIGCFLLTFLVGWWFGRGMVTPVEAPPDDPPTLIPTVEAVVIISTASTSDIYQSLKRADRDHGEELYREYGCINCHALDGSVGSGPPLNGITERIPEGYESAEAYLIEMILDPPDPADDLRGGYTNAMPSNYDELFEAQDVADLIVFLLRQ